MVDTPGRCRELDYCSIGQMRSLVRVPLGRPFICPECGRPLHAPSVKPPASGCKPLAIWVGAAAGIAVLLILAVGLSKSLDGSAAKHRRIVLAAQQAARPQAQPPPPLQTLAAAQLAPAAVTETATLTETLPALQLTQLSPAAPDLAHPLPILTLATLQIAPAVTAQVTDLAHLVPLLGLDAAPPPLEPAAIQTLASGQAVPSAHIQLATIVARLPALALTDPDASPAVVKPLPPDHGFSPAPVAGGAPPYPIDYIHDRRIGEVSLTCTIEPDGEPTGCKVHDLAGGRRFAEATVDWLNSGAAHYAPIVRLGRPVSQEEHWTIAFKPPR